MAMGGTKGVKDIARKNSINMDTYFTSGRIAILEFSKIDFTLAAAFPALASSRIAPYRFTIDSSSNN